MATGAPRSPEDEPQNRWFFTREQLLNSPSRSDGVDVEKELAYRQQAASLIKNMGDHLKVYVYSAPEKLSARFTLWSIVCSKSVLRVF